MTAPRRGGPRAPPRRDPASSRLPAVAKATKQEGAEAPQRSRIAIVLTGVVLGAVWGTLMWGLFELLGRDSGVRGWAYLAFTVAMLGGGVAAFFGATGAARRGEQIGPKLPFGRKRDR